MIKPKELFILEGIDDDPIYEGFEIDDIDKPSLIGRENLLEDLIPGYDASETVRKWTPVYLEDIWEPVTVTGRVAPFNDSPSVDGLPAFSQRACDILREYLEPNGELLPLDSNVGQYFFFNITTIVDVLDVNKSICHFWCDPPTTAVDIESYQFYEERLSDLSIFRIYDNPIEVFVTDQFVRKVFESGLNGFSFKKVWPLKEGVDWRMYNKKHSLDNNIIDIGVKKHTFVIVLNLLKEKPTDNEKNIIEKIEDELDYFLHMQTIDEPYYGTYEGNDIVNSEFRIFISSPDVDKLVIKLLPWLENIHWDEGMYALKRYGDMHNEDAKESVLDLE